MSTKFEKCSEKDTVLTAGMSLRVFLVDEHIGQNTKFLRSENAEPLVFERKNVLGVVLPFHLTEKVFEMYKV